MDKVESPKLPAKLSRKYSETTIDTRFTRSSFQEAESPDHNCRRKVSFDHKNKALREEDDNREEKKLL
jgi:hypothetical protein